MGFGRQTYRRRQGKVEGTKRQRMLDEPDEIFERIHLLHEVPSVLCFPALAIHMTGVMKINWIKDQKTKMFCKLYINGGDVEKDSVDGSNLFTPVALFLISCSISIILPSSA